MEKTRESDAVGQRPLSPPNVSPEPGLVSGVRLLFDGIGMLVRERSLWALAAVPVTFCAVALTAAGSLIYVNAAGLHEMLTSWMPALEVTAYYEWLWLGPAKLLLALLGVGIFAAFSAVAVLVAVLIANLASAPFLDALSKRVESIAVGNVAEVGEGGLAAIGAEARRSIANEFQRLVLFVVVWGVISLGGVLVPGGQLVAPVALFLFTAVFLPLDYSGYHFDRRQVSFRMRRDWLLDNFSTMLGFGSTAMGTALVPGLNLLLLPSLVIAGTLLALRHPIDT